MNIYFIRHVYAIALCLLFSCSISFKGNRGQIHFSDIEHDFGVVELQKEAVFSFEFSNPGETPVIIQDVLPSCGCTAAEWTTEPVKPGQVGFIKVKYDAAFSGVFHKEIVVHYNGHDSPLVLSIKGQVEFSDSLQSLKL